MRSLKSSKKGTQNAEGSQPTPWNVSHTPNIEQTSPLKNLDFFLKKEFFWLTFFQSWRLNKHTRNLKKSRHTPDKQKQDKEHNIMIEEWEPISS